MSLTPGTRLGVYEVTAQIGEGGKVLHESLSGDPQFRERFDREARAISQLTHPHTRYGHPQLE